MFAKGPGDQGSILGQVIPKTQKKKIKIKIKNKKIKEKKRKEKRKEKVLDAALLNPQHNVRTKDKVEQSRKWSSAEAMEKRAFRSLSTKVANFTFTI